MILMHIFNEHPLNCHPKHDSSSSGEIEVRNFLRQYLSPEEFIIKNKTILNGQELDIYIPSKNLAIEYNGLFWHCTENKEKDYHQQKSDRCLEQGINLIHLWEDDWREKKEMVQSILLQRMNQSHIIIQKFTSEKITDSSKIREFLQQNSLYSSILSSILSSINLGLVQNNMIISLMGVDLIDDQYQIRYWVDQNYTKIIEGKESLWKYFLQEYQPSKVIFPLNRSYFDPKEYYSLGFINSGYSEPHLFTIEEKIRCESGDFLEEYHLFDAGDYLLQFNPRIHS